MVSGRRSVSLVSSWKYPSTHVSGGSWRARACSFSMMLRMLTCSTSKGFPTSTSYSSTSPRPWLWVSMNPGTTAIPLASCTRVRRPASARTSAEPPTAVKRPAVTAKASARGCRGSMVCTRAFTTTRSGSCDASGGAGRAMATCAASSGAPAMAASAALEAEAARNDRRLW